MRRSPLNLEDQSQATTCGGLCAGQDAAERASCGLQLQPGRRRLCTPCLSGLCRSLAAGRRELVRFLCRWDADFSRTPWLAFGGAFSGHQAVMILHRLKSSRDCRGRLPQDLYLYRQGSEA